MIASPQILTPNEYLELESQSQAKHEYINGRVLAMAGTTDIHNTIALNLATTIRTHLRGPDCSIYFAEIKARLEECNCFYCPDLLVTCEPKDRETPTYKRFPKLIIEVLSDSTEALDRGDKFRDYRTLPTLEKYVLVNSKCQQVETFRRTGQEGLWLLQTYIPPEPLELQSIELSVEFPEIYADVTLKQPGEN